MSKLTIRYNNQTKTITIPRAGSPEQLGKIVESIFGIRGKIVGMTDEQGKFYDLPFISDNLQMLRAHQLDLVTARDTNQDNMSFASENVEAFEQKNRDDNTHETEPLRRVSQGYLGEINDLAIFEDLMLEDKKLAIVMCSSKDKTGLKISHNFYVYYGGHESVIVYYDRKKIAELFIDDWKNVETKIDPIIRNLRQIERPAKADSNHEIIARKVDEDFDDASNKSVQADNQMAVEEIKATFLENIAKLRDEQTISELEYYKLKAKLYENPEDFMRKYQMGTRQGFRKRKSIDELREEIIRSKEEKSRYQTIINEFRDIRAPSRQDTYNNRNYKNQIPIIVRKYNNVIEKISTSYPLNLQQEQAINLIMELELKGLISQNDARVYKSQILQEEPEIFALFSEYFKDSIDQIELAHKLKNKKKNDKKSQEEKHKSEDIVRMIIKYAKRNSFELLRNLAVEGNEHILKCYDDYQRNKNGNLFASSLEKVANYYRAKSKLESEIDEP